MTTRTAPDQPGPLCAAPIPDETPHPVLTGVLCGEDAIPGSRFCPAHDHLDNDLCGG